MEVHLPHLYVCLTQTTSSPVFQKLLLDRPSLSRMDPSWLLARAGHNKAVVFRSRTTTPSLFLSRLVAS